MRHCRFLSVAALGAMLAFPASAQTGSESQTPSTAAPGSESQTPSAATPGSESQTPSAARPGAETESASPGAPTSSDPAVPEANPAPETTQPRKAAAPEILIMVSKPTQSMTVTVDGRVRYRWRVSTGATHYSNSGRFLHSVSYGANALFAGVRQCGYATCDLFHATGTQHSWLGPSWPWHRSVSWVCSSHTFKRNYSLSTRQVGRHGEDEGRGQWP